MLRRLLEREMGLPLDAEFAWIGEADNHLESQVNDQGILKRFEQGLSDKRASSDAIRTTIDTLNSFVDGRGLQSGGYKSVEFRLPNGSSMRVKWFSGSKRVSFGWSA